MLEYIQYRENQFIQRQFYRVNHDTTLWRAGLPEVFRLDPDIHVLLTEPIQWLWRRMNPQLTDLQWSACLGNTLAFTNGTGFPGRRNWILKDELSAKDPAFDQARVCGGATLCGVEDGENLVIESIDIRETLPSAEYVMKRRWLYYEAVNIDGQRQADGSIKTVIRPFKGAWGKKVYIPLLTPFTMTYPLKYMTKLPLGSIPPNNYQYP